MHVQYRANPWLEKLGAENDPPGRALAKGVCAGSRRTDFFEKILFFISIQQPVLKSDNNDNLTIYI